MQAGKGKMKDVDWCTFDFIFPCEGSELFLEVLQDQVNPWKSRSKLLHLLLFSKISLISMVPLGAYQILS